MEDEIVNLEETGGGDTAEMQIAPVGRGETESILVVLTSIFLTIATIMIALKLYTGYGFFKDQTTVTDEEAKIEKSVTGR